MKDKLPFRIVQGLEEKIMNIPIQEGYVYFTTDTKKIYLDSNKARLSMGGNAGIYYANINFGDSVGPEFYFPFDAIEGINIPNIDDLILNTDGCFYKIIEKLETEFKTKRITLSGTGGSGGSNVGDIDMSIVGSIYPTILTNSKFSLEFILNATDKKGNNTGDGRYEIRVNNVSKKTGIAKNSASLDTPVINRVEIGDLFSTEGDYTVQVICYAYTGAADEQSVSQRVYVTATDFNINWDESPNIPHNIDENFNTSWTVSIGGENIKSTIIIDDTYTISDLDTSLSLSPTDLVSYNLTHGVHKFELYSTAIIGNSSIPSDSIIKNLIFYNEEDTSYIIICDFFETNIQQYDTIQLPIKIYHPNNNSNGYVEFFANGEPKGREDNLQNFEEKVFAYTPDKAGLIDLRFNSNNGGFLSLILDVKPLDIDIEEVSGYEFKFKATDFSNNDEIKKWSYNNQLIEFSENFDWINGGLNAGVNDIGPYFKIPIGSHINIPYKLFERNLLISGGNLKVIFKAYNCRDYDAEVLSCYEKIGATEVGLQLQAQNGTVKYLGGSSDGLQVQYCEDTYIEYEFDISDKYLTVWLDGIPAVVTPISSSDSFQQSNAKYIKIGSDDCDVYLYLIKFYKKHLTDKEHLANFIMDAPKAQEMKSRYDRNNILTKDSSGNEYISPTLLAKANPDCNVFVYSVPYIPTSKNDVIDSTGNSECCSYIQYKGSDQAIRSYEGVKLRAQGTSSMTYGVSAYNLDAKFPEKWSLSNEAIPVNYLNTKVNVASCEGANNALNQEWYNQHQPYKTQKRLQHRTDGKIARDTMEFINGVLFIEDHNKTIDSSNATANNIFKEINGYVNKPYPRMYSIANMGNSKKNHDVFHGAGNKYECCVEVADNNTNGHQMTIIGGYVFGKDSSYEVAINFSNEDDIFDENGFVKDNADWGTSVDPKTGLEVSNKDLWKNALIKEGLFEFRYCIDEDDFVSDEEFSTYEEYQENLSNRFLRLVRWFAKNNPANATNKEFENGESITFEDYKIKGIKETAYSNYNTADEILKGVVVPGGTFTADTKEYRIAKMLRESENYLILDSVVYHYLFIERHTMVDNVAKNTFWNTEDGIHWELTKNYDNDTADGVNNNGVLAFNYGTEIMDNDNIGKAIFNARDSAWLNFVDGLIILREKMYQKLTTAWEASSYLQKFEKWQNVIPEICWIEDFYRKYFRPKEIYNDSNYLPRLANGKKTHQRKQYETYQEQYMNSEYKVNTGKGNLIDWRSEQPVDSGIIIDEDTGKKEFTIGATVKMYADGYITAAIASGAGEAAAVNIHIRAKKGEVIPFSKTQNSPFNNATGYLYSPALYSEFMGIENLYPDYVAAGAGTKLRKISLIAKTQYQQTPLQTSLTFPDNIEEIVIQNCSNVSRIGLNLLNQKRLKVLNTEGSNFRTITIADGAPLSILKLEEPQALTMKNLYFLRPEEEYFKINNYNYLRIVDLNNIDFNVDLLETKNISKFIIQNALNTLQTDENGTEEKIQYNLSNVGWEINNSNEIINNSILLLDKLLLQIPKNETKANSLTGNCKITENAYNGNDSILIYNKYSLLSDIDNTYPNLDLNFTGTDSQLYTINVMNGDNQIVWSRKIVSLSNLTNDLLNSGSLGAFNTSLAIFKSDDPNYIYEFANKWEYKTSQGDTGEIEGANLNLELITVNNSKADITIKPVYNKTTHYYTITFYDNNFVELYKISNATYGQTFNEIKPNFIPVKDDSELDLTQTYKFKGYSSINGSSTIINEELWTVSNDTSLFTVFEETSVYKIDYSNYLNITSEGILLGLKIFEENAKEQFVYSGEKLVIPKNVKIIGAHSFENNNTLKSIFIQSDSNLKTISQAAFKNSQLEYFEFTNTIEKFGAESFKNCLLDITNYGSIGNSEYIINMPTNLTTINSSAFNNCFKNIEGAILTMNIKNNISIIDNLGLAHWNILANINIGGTDGINHSKDLSNISALAIRSNARTSVSAKDIRRVTLYSTYYESGSEQTSPSEELPFWDEDTGNNNVLFYVPSVIVTKI